MQVKTIHAVPFESTPSDAPTRIDLNLLMLFLEIVNAKSISQAATRLQVPKATLSRKLRQLERQVGAVLASANRGQTRLIIAHRADTAARTDLVAWLDRGTVRSLRPHRELWRDPDYRALFGTDAILTQPQPAAPGPAHPSEVPV